MHSPAACVIPGCPAEATLAYVAVSAFGHTAAITRPDGTPICSCDGHAIAVCNRIATMLQGTPDEPASIRAVRSLVPLR